MASTVDDYIQTLYPKLSLSPSKDVYVEMAELQTSSAFYGTSYELALALRACHYFYLDDQLGGSGGVITSKTESRTSVSYWNSVPENDHSNLAGSSFGQRLKALIRSKGTGASIGVPDAWV